jgi:hypothetical protein
MAGISAKCPRDVRQAIKEEKMVQLQKWSQSPENFKIDVALIVQLRFSDVGQ